MTSAPRILVFASAAALALGCSNQILTESGGTGPGSGTACTGAACACGATASVERITQGGGGKVDLLVVDDSGSMADKQQLLALAPASSPARASTAAASTRRTRPGTASSSIRRPGNRSR